jgi:hypothetical protein
MKVEAADRPPGAARRHHIDALAPGCSVAGIPELPGHGHALGLELDRCDEFVDEVGEGPIAGAGRERGVGSDQAPEIR